MEPVVDQSLGDILDLDTTTLLERPGIHDALVSNVTVATLVQHGVVRSQAMRHVVGI